MNNNNPLIDNEAYFQELRNRPFIAWPTVILLFASLTVIASVWYAVLNDHLPLWAGFIINCIAYYYLFSPIHDGIHRSISPDEKINDFISSIAYLPVSIFMGGHKWARMFHTQHHRHTGKEGIDPDIEISSKATNALWLWFVWGFHYRGYFLKYGDKLPTVKQAPFNRTRMTVSLILFAYMAFAAPLEFIFLWLIPLYTGISWMTAFVFSYLPHHIHKRKEGEDPLDTYQSTCNITGYEWLLSPLMQYQNYHLVHHLYPTVPFYRMVKIWNAAQSKHVANNPAEIALAKS